MSTISSQSLQNNQLFEKEGHDQLIGVRYLPVRARQQSIANILMLHHNSVPNPGLYSGKMGMALFLYHYARHYKQPLYEDIAGDILDDIMSSLHSGTPVDFTNGLSGIGWGIEYLTANKFLAANTDEVLEELDQAVFKYVSVNENNSNYQNLLGIAPYIIARLKDKVHQADNVHLNYRRVLEKILFFCGKILTDHSSQNITSIDQFNSVVFFLRGMIRLELCVAEVEKLFGFLPPFFVHQCKKEGQWHQYSTLYHLLKTAEQYISDDNTLSNYRGLSGQINMHLNKQYPEVTNGDALFYNIRSVTLKNLIYEIKPEHNTNKELFKCALRKIEDPDFWHNKLDSLNINKPELYAELAVLGLSIILSERSFNDI